MIPIKQVLFVVTAIAVLSIGAILQLTSNNGIEGPENDAPLLTSSPDHVVVHKNRRLHKVPATASVPKKVTTPVRRELLVSPVVMDGEVVVLSDNSDAPSSSSKSLWSNDFQVVHLVHTRFMQHQGHLEHLAKARLDLFKTFTLPSMMLQSSQQFLWLIWIDPKLETGVRQELLSLVANLPNVLVIGSEVAKGHNLRSMFGHDDWMSLEQRIVSGNERLLSDYYDASHHRLLAETRLDADDALSLSYVESTQIQVAAAIGRGDHASLGHIQHFCPASHVEWRYYKPDERRSQGATNEGYLIHVSNPDFCINSGTTSVYHLESFGLHYSSSNAVATTTTSSRDLAMSHDSNHRALWIPIAIKVAAACAAIAAAALWDDEEGGDTTSGTGDAVNVDGDGNIVVTGGNVQINMKKCNCECQNNRRERRQQRQLDTCSTSAPCCSCDPPPPPPTCTIGDYTRRCRRERALEELFGGEKSDEEENEVTTADNAQHCQRRLRLLPLEDGNDDDDDETEDSSNSKIHKYQSLPALVLMARTPTAAGMKNVMPNKRGGGVNSIQLDTFDIDNKNNSNNGDNNDKNESGGGAAVQAWAWQEMKRQFGIDKSAVVALHDRMEIDMEHILVDAFAGQCTPGHSCKESTKKALGTLLTQTQKHNEDRH